MKRLKGACTYKCGFEYGFYQDFVVNDIWECFKPPNKKKTHYKRNGYSHHGFWSFNWFVKSLAKYWYFICEFMSLQHCCHVNKGMQGKNGYICNQEIPDPLLAIVRFKLLCVYRMLPYNASIQCLSFRRGWGSRMEMRREYVTIRIGKKNCRQFI